MTRADFRLLAEWITAKIEEAFEAREEGPDGSRGGSKRLRLYRAQVEARVVAALEEHTALTPDETYVRRCSIHPRDADPVLFTESAEHGIQCTLDGYAIIPIEEYEQLKRAALAANEKTP